MAEASLSALRLPSAYALDATWPQRAARLPYAKMGFIEWSLEGRRVPDLMSGARASTPAWAPWWQQAFGPWAPQPPACIVEAWVEQDAPCEPHAPPTEGYFWGFGADSTAEEKTAWCDVLCSAFPRVQPALQRTALAIENGLPVRWIGIFPHREGQSIRINLSRRLSPDILQSLMQGEPALLRLHSQLSGPLFTAQNIAWCFDEDGQQRRRWMAEITPLTPYEDFVARQHELRNMLAQLLLGHSAHDDALALVQAFEGATSVIPPPHVDALPLWTDWLCAPKPTPLRYFRRIAHLKAELTPPASPHALQVKIYGAFTGPNASTEFPSPSPDDAVWPELARALQKVAWPWTASTLQQHVPRFAGIRAEAVAHAVQEHGRFLLARHLAHTQATPLGEIEE